MRDILTSMAVILGSVAVVLGLAATQFRTTPQQVEVFPWIFFGYMCGSMTTLVYLLWKNRPKPKQRRTLDQMADKLVQVEMPTEHTTRH